MICTAKEFASVSGLSVGTVSGLLSAGMPSSGAGRQGRAVSIDTRQAIPWMLARERESAPQRQGGERERLASEQADRAELENQVRRGELVAVQSVAAVLMNMGSEFGRQLEALPGRSASELAGITDPALVRAKLQDECRKIRTQVEEHIKGFAVGPGADAPGLDGDGGDRRAAKKARARPVGRRKSNPAARKCGTRRVAK